MGQKSGRCPGHCPIHSILFSPLNICKMEKAIQTGWRATPSIINKLREKAKAERRTVTQQLAIILEDYFENEEKKK